MSTTVVKLVLSGHQHPDAVNFPVRSSGEGVDIGAIARYFRLDPTTVRLSGHFLSRGPRLVSSVTWDSLLSFLSARGFPAGTSDRDAIVVQGKPASASVDLEDEDHLSFKRKIRLEDERPAKKNRVSVNNSATQKVGNGEVSDDGSIRIGGRLKLDDNHPSKKPKTSHCTPDLASEASKLPTVPPRIGFSHNCIDGFGKRLRGEEELVVPVSCKRIK